MAAYHPRASRLLLDVFHPTRPRPICQCLRVSSPVSRDPSSRRHISSAPSQRSEMEVDTSVPPRWSQTPPAMKAPVPSRLRLVSGRNSVNKDPRRLDETYVRFLGPGGDRLLTEETKWLAVTHKSFDHGRRGFNDRLAFLGKRIVELQASLGLLSIAGPSSARPDSSDPYGRQPFQHPATDGAECLTDPARTWLTYHKQISKVAEDLGFPAVVRWVPRNPESLAASGAEMVYAQALFAIVGAIALEKGGAVANEVARDRILRPIGLFDQR